MIFLRDIKDENIVKHVADRISEQTKRTFEKESFKDDISISIVIAVGSGEGNTFSDLYNMADKALYDVKTHGKHSWKIYDGEAK